MNKLYDCFLFWKEFNALEIRLNELYDVVDKFIIVEFSQGHSGSIKPFYLKNRMEEFSKFSDKIHLFSLDIQFENSSPLNIAHNQRRVLDEIIKSMKLKSNDLVLTSDSDEIVKSSVLREYKTSSREVDLMFELDIFHNHLNNFFGKWTRPRLVSSEIFKGFCFSYRDIFLVNNARYRRIKWFPFMRVNPFFSATKLDGKVGAWVGFKGKKVTIVENAGWHFTKIYAVEDHFEHFQSTPHVEVRDERVTMGEMTRRIKQNFNSYGGLARGKIVRIDESFPYYVQQNQERFSKFILSLDSE